MRSQKAMTTLKAPELLIVAAHSDDCVIAGAEMAWGILQEEGKVRIAYLTCSGPSPADEISKVRTAEAIAAWRHLHNQNVYFTSTDLPESPVNGPISYGETDLDRFRDLLVNNINAMKEGSVVLLTARHESHVDHNSARLAGIRAIEKAKRSDLRVFETPEYNSLLSMRHDPIGVMITALKELPLLYRILPKRSASPAFLGGKIAATFVDNPKRLEAKIEMLGEFVSQNPELLREYFSWPSKYRLFDESPDYNYFQLLGKTADFSVIWFLIFIYLVILPTSISVSIEHQVAATLVATVGICFAVFALKKRRLIPGILAGSLVPGAMLGGLL